MIVDLTKAVWLHESHPVSLEELAGLSGISAFELKQLLESGALIPSTKAPVEAQFDSSHIAVLRKLNRLTEDFELDFNAMCISLALLQKVYWLEMRVKAMSTRGNFTNNGPAPNQAE